MDPYKKKSDFNAGINTSKTSSKPLNTAKKLPKTPSKAKKRPSLSPNSFSTPQQEPFKAIDFTSTKSVVESLLKMVVYHPSIPFPVDQGKKSAPLLSKAHKQKSSDSAHRKASKAIDAKQAGPAQQSAEAHQDTSEAIYASLENTLPNLHVMDEVKALRADKEAAQSSKYTLRQFKSLARRLRDYNKMHQGDSPPERQEALDWNHYEALLNENKFEHNPDKAKHENTAVQSLFAQEKQLDQSSDGYIHIDTDSENDDATP